MGGTGFSHYRTYGMYAMVLIKGDGSGRYRDRNGTDRRVTAGDLIVVFPDLPHQYGPETGDVWEEIFVAFDGAAFEGWRAHGLDPAQPVWSLGEPEAWTRRFGQILGMPVATRPDACAAANAVHLLIADALEARALQPRSLPWLEGACQTLGQGEGGPSLQEIARNAGMGYEAFRKAFKAATGEPPARYRRRLRLAQAALLIQRADLSLEMIARALDFCDAFHLSKAFKLQYGKAPAVLRGESRGSSGPGKPYGGKG